MCPDGNQYLSSFSGKLQSSGWQLKLTQLPSVLIKHTRNLTFLLLPEASLAPHSLISLQSGLLLSLALMYFFETSQINPCLYLAPCVAQSPHRILTGPWIILFPLPLHSHCFSPPTEFCSPPTALARSVSIQICSLAAHSSATCFFYCTRLLRISPGHQSLLGLCTVSCSTAARINRVRSSTGCGEEKWCTSSQPCRKQVISSRTAESIQKRQEVLHSDIKDLPDLLGNEVCPFMCFVIALFIGPLFAEAGLDSNRKEHILLVRTNTTEISL